MIAGECSIGLILRHFLEVYRVFVSSGARKCKHGVPSQDYDELRETEQYVVLEAARRGLI